MLRLVFLTCHPVLTPESRAALTLRLVGGLTTAEIARGFLTTEATMAQRISRAKKTLASAGIVLELPTGGFADAMGRRPVLVAAAAVNLVAGAVLILGTSFWTFAIGAALQGVFRALDSGPLEAWYVDTVHATEPEADVDQTLSAEGTVMGASMATGAVISGGLIAWDPLPADTLFHEDARKRYDAHICLYHDQALIPVKTLDFWGGVNATLGLPIVRTSPDHGTGFDIAGKGIARADSFIAAVKLASEMAAKRATR